MDLKTESGVSIKIITEGSSKILLFNKPVRAIELKEQETSQISALLVSSLEKKDVPLSKTPLNSTKAAKKAPG